MSTTHVIPVNRTVFTERTVHIIECAHCAIDFGIGGDFMRRRREDHVGFYCPNGHSNYYSGPTAEEKALKKAEQERDAARSLAERESRRRFAAEAEAKRQDYKARAAKGQLTKERKRIASGVCPCCNRSFSQVRRHIATQHPDYVIPEVTP